MEKIIQFRKGIDSLDDEEYKRCTTWFKDSLLSLLFNAFCNELKEEKMDNINKMNEIITKIIRSRNDEDEDDEDIDIEAEDEEIENVKDIKLDELPSDILPEIVSYLEFDERLQFEKSNRSIFIDIRSSKVAIHPLHHNQFKKLVRFYYDNPKEGNLRKLRIFKSLRMDCRDFEEYLGIKYKWNNFDLLHYIESLQINFDDPSYLKLLLSDLNECDDLSNIKMLRLNGEEDITFDDLFNLKSIITNKLKLEYFECSGWFDHDVTFLHNDWFSKLKGISINDHNEQHVVMESVHSAMGHKLESFHQEYIMTDNMNGKMNELKEFCLSWYLNEKEIKILIKQNMKNLKRIYFKDSEMNLHGFDDESVENMELFFNKIMKTAEYPTSDLFDILIKSLKNTKKKTLKIRIDAMKLEDNNVNNINEMIANLKELITVLNTNISHWMLIVHHLQIPTSNELDGFLSSILSKHHVKSNKTKSKEGGNKYNVVINNEGCDINGYQEHWIMQCSKCQQNTLFD